MGWKIYFWILAPLITAATGLSIAESFGFVLDEGEPFLDEPLSWLDWMDTIVMGVSLVGLFGIAHQKTIGKQIFWKRWFILVVIFDIAYTFNDYRNGIYDIEEMWRPAITFSFLAAIILPYYIALFLYGYKSDSLWNPKPTLPQ